MPQRHPIAGPHPDQEIQNLWRAMRTQEGDLQVLERQVTELEAAPSEPGVEEGGPIVAGQLGNSDFFGVWFAPDALPWVPEPGDPGDFEWGEVQILPPSTYFMVLDVFAFVLIPIVYDHGQGWLSVGEAGAPSTLGPAHQRYAQPWPVMGSQVKSFVPSVTSGEWFRYAVAPGVGISVYYTYGWGPVTAQPQPMFHVLIRYLEVGDPPEVNWP